MISRTRNVLKSPRKLHLITRSPGSNDVNDTEISSVELEVMSCVAMLTQKQSYHIKGVSEQVSHSKTQLAQDGVPLIPDAPHHVSSTSLH